MNHIDGYQCKYCKTFFQEFNQEKFEQIFDRRGRKMQYKSYSRDLLYNVIICDDLDCISRHKISTLRVRDD